MMKTIFCLALVLCVAQGSSILEALRSILEEKDLEERGVYLVTKTSTSISGTVQIDIQDCPAPENGCSYTVTATNTRGNDAQSQTAITSANPVTFSFTNLDPSGVYELSACIVVNGRNGCGPKTAVCDMRTRNTFCSYSLASAKISKDLETRGVMLLSADSSSISGTVQVDIRDCPKPYNCDYTVTCKNLQTGDMAQVQVNTLNSATKPFSCNGLSGGVYQVSACKQGSSMCGPRVGSCDLSSGKCSLKIASSVKKSQDETNAIVDKIEELLDDLRE